MPSWFRRRKRRQQPIAADVDLERFFTNAEEARGRFAALLAGSPGGRQMIVIHGVGAVGKSSLLRMYRLTAHRDQVPAALVGGEEAAAAVDLLERWVADLAADGVDLPKVTASLVRYRELEVRAEDAARRAGETENGATAQKLAGVAAKGALKVAASAVPFAGLLVDAVGNEAVDAVLNLLRATFSRSDLTFFLDPTTRLTDDFANDLERAARRQRLVLMLDTFEQVTALSDWLRGLAQRLPADALLVIAGRAIPDWDRAWPGWLGRAEIIELTEMSDDDVERLVRQYHGLFGRGEPDAEQVRAVVRFARGLPMAATTAVRLWLNYQLTDLQPVRAGAVADLADRLVEGVPAELRPAFEAAAVLRFFNADSLAALLGDAHWAGCYDELRRWPFTRARREGLAVHDTMREVMNEALAARSPEQFRQLNERAAAYYAGLVAGPGADDRERPRLEWLYHTIRASEREGIRHFREMAEELVRYQWVGRLRALVNEANSYPLAEESSRQWRRYYAARLEHIEGRSAVAEAEYRVLSVDEGAESVLRAYALCDLGAIYVTLDRLAEPGGEARALNTIEQSQRWQPELDPKLVTNHVSLMNMSNTRSDWDQSLDHLRPVREFARANHDGYGLVTVDHLVAAIHGLRGDWQGYLQAREDSKAALQGLGDVPALQMEVAYFTWPLVYMGRYREAQESSEEALKLAIRLEEKELMITILESIALARGMQDDDRLATESFDQAWNFYENFHAPLVGEEVVVPERYVRAMLSFRGLVALRAGRLDQADADLRRALDIKQNIHDQMGVPELHVWRGELYEQRKAWGDAEAAYREAVDLRGVGREYFESVAWAGLARVEYANGRHDACRQHIASAERLASRYEYNDVLASLRLIEGHLAWQQVSPDGDVSAVLACYQPALVHALRFNRFILDEVLAGRPQGTPLSPIVSTCLGRGADGRRVLELTREWWRSGLNALASGPARGVSPLPEGSALLAAETTARRREPGGGTPQATVLEQLDAALER